MKKFLFLCVLFLTTLLASAQIIETDGRGMVITTKGRAVEVRFSKSNITVSPDNRSLIVSPEIFERCFISVAGVAPLVIKESSSSNWIFSEDFKTENGETEKQVCLKYSLPKNHPNVAREAMMFLTSDEAIHIIQMPAIELAKLSVPRAVKKPVVDSIINSTTVTTTSTSTKNTTKTTLTITETPGSITGITTSGEIQLPGSTVTDSTTKLTQTLGPGSISNSLFGFRNTKGTIKRVDPTLLNTEQLKYSMLVSIDSREFPIRDVIILPVNTLVARVYSPEQCVILDYYWGNTSKAYIIAQPGRVGEKNRDTVSCDILDSFMLRFLIDGAGDISVNTPEGFKIPDQLRHYKRSYAQFSNRIAKTDRKLTGFESYFTKYQPVKSNVNFMGDSTATRYRMDVNYYDELIYGYGVIFSPLTFRYDVYSFYSKEANTTVWATFCCIGFDIEPLKKSTLTLKKSMGPDETISFYEAYSEHLKEVSDRKLKNYTLESYPLKCNVDEFEKNLVFFKHSVPADSSVVVSTALPDSVMMDSVVMRTIVGDSVKKQIVTPVQTTIVVDGVVIPWSNTICILSPPSLEVISSSKTTSKTTTKTVRTTTLDTTLLVSFKRADIAQQVAKNKPTSSAAPQMAVIAAGRVTDMVYDAKNLYLASQLDSKYCLVVVDKATGTMRTFDFPDGIKKLLVDHKGRLIIHSGDGVRVWDGVSKESSKLIIKAAAEDSKHKFLNPICILPSGNMLAWWNTYELKPYGIIDPATGIIKRSVELSVPNWNGSSKNVINKVVATTSGNLFGGDGKLQMFIEGVDGTGEVKMTPLKDIGYDKFMDSYESGATNVVANRFKPQMLFATSNGLVCWDEPSRQFSYLARGNRFQKVDCVASDKVWVQLQSPYTPKGGYGFTPILAYYDFSVSTAPIATVEHPSLYGFTGDTGRIYADDNGNLYAFDNTKSNGLLIVNLNGIKGFDTVKGK